MYPKQQTGLIYPVEQPDRSFRGNKIHLYRLGTLLFIPTTVPGNRAARSGGSQLPSANGAPSHCVYSCCPWLPAPAQTRLGPVAPGAPHVIGHRPGGGCPHVGRWPSPLVSAAAPTRGVVRGVGGGPGGKGTRRPPCASSLRVRAFRCRDVSPPPPSRPPPTCRRGLPRSPAACPATPAARAGVGRDPADEPAAGAPAWPPRAATRRWPHGGGSGLLYLLPLPPPVSRLAPPLLFSPPPLPVLLRPPLRFRRAAEASPVGRCGRPPPFSPSPVPAISCFPMHLRPPIIRSSALS